MSQPILFLTLIFLCFFSPAAQCQDLPSRGLFVSVIQDPPVFSSQQSIETLIQFSIQAHIKVLFVQIYRAGDAWFPSQIADDSYFEKYKSILKTDPLALLVKQAHAHGIQVHGWLNLMSLGSNIHAHFLKKYGTDILTRNLNEKSKIEDYKIDNQYFLEPGDPRVRDDLSRLVKEILSAYPDLDGIQFDYIRYPDVNPHYGYTKINTQRFKKKFHLENIDEKSSLWMDWRRQQVTDTLMALVKVVRTMRPKMLISTTGCMPYARAYYEAYQDWPSWLSKGIIDFVTIMDYSTDLQQFERWINALKDKIKDFSKVRIAVGAYKMVKTPEIFKEEFNSCERMNASCTVFHYGSLVDSPPMASFLTRQE